MINTKIRIYISLIYLVCVHCAQRNSPEDYKIESLDTFEAREQFLSKLFDDDQRVRNSKLKQRVLKESNYDLQSNTYKSYVNKQIKMDSINFSKAIAYLKQHEYPSNKVYSSSASLAIWAVGLHQVTYEKRLELFPYLFKSYKNSNLSDEFFATYVSEMYTLKFKKRFKTSMNQKEDINHLLDTLNL